MCIDWSHSYRPSQPTWAVLRSDKPIQYWTRIFHHVCFTDFTHTHTHLQFSRLQGLTDIQRLTLLVQILHPVVCNVVWWVPLSTSIRLHDNNIISPDWKSSTTIQWIVMTHCTHICEYMNDYWMDWHAVCSLFFPHLIPYCNGGLLLSISILCVALEMITLVSWTTNISQQQLAAQPWNSVQIVLVP